MLSFNTDFDVDVDISCDVGLMLAADEMWKMRVQGREFTTRPLFKRCASRTSFFATVRLGSWLVE
ncbi:hypothetical protein BHYA_0033g00620 [Botrytis hyacinthi]|uniref:Uncharacterized protein n=1 Tax=Botrytis hyacinthi TaxID=278943 RepID=A0A4Z1GW98_9HELO|nr:hypothetical protein BHYA_0033g00620 [Botrytis hyacinthi]